MRIAQKNILGNRHSSDLAQFLLRQRHTLPFCVRRRTETDEPPAPEDFALIVRIEARHDLDCRRLARAVLAEKRHHLARPDQKTDLGQRLNSPESPADGSKLERVRGGRNAHGILAHGASCTLSATLSMAAARNASSICSRPKTASVN